jgi:prepilin-type N-terminal cleavage/methylation domain-containing protein
MRTVIAKNNHTIHLASQLLKRHSGFNLIELMVAMVIGIFLLAVVGSIVLSAQLSFNTSNRLVRVQQNGHLAKNMVTNDLKRARYMGSNMVLDAANLFGTEGQEAPAAGCDTTTTTWARMVMQGLFGVDDVQIAGGSTYACITALVSGAVGSYKRGDILTVRYAAPWDVSTFVDDKLYIRSSFVSSWIFLGINESNASNDESSFPDPIKDVHELIAYSYYIGDSGRDCNSINGTVDVDSLFRVSINAGNPTTEEIFPGIEDFQVQFSTDGIVYVDANNVTDWDAVVATQFWLLAKSECEEIGLVDNNIRTLAGVTRPAPNDGFRRELYYSFVNHRN